jgi:hypothetical protein
MKRLLVLLAVLIPLSLLIVGCGQDGSSGKPKEHSIEEQKKMQSTMKGMMKGGMDPKGTGFPGAPGGRK